jgi:membrane protease YdiL (CAAX protease family)
VIVAVAAVLAYKAFKRWVERTPDTDFAGPGAVAEFALGVIMGFALLCTAAAIVAMSGGFAILGVRGLGDFWIMLSVAISSGPFEETLFRAIGLRLLERAFGTSWALALTSAFFGFAHLFNPGSTVFDAFAIAIEAGILLGAAYLLTRRLWLAIGVHSAWNFTEGWVFGSPVSGGPMPHSLFVTRWTGPDWLTGGAFGLEASAPAVAVTTLAGLALLWIVHRRGTFRPPPWRAQTKL